MCRFGEHLRHLEETHGQLTFIISEDSGTRPLAVVPLATDTINALIRNQAFEVSRVRFAVTSKLLPTQIYLCFGQACMYSISGFPRCFNLENQVTSPKTMEPNALSNSSASRYTHGSRRRKGTSSSWKPPDIRTAPSFWKLHDYSNRLDRVLGYDILKSDLEDLSDPDRDIVMPQQDQGSTPTKEGYPIELAKETFATEPRDRWKWNIHKAFMALLGPLWNQRLDKRSETQSLYEKDHFIKPWLASINPGEEDNHTPQEREPITAELSAGRDGEFQRYIAELPTDHNMVVQQYNVSRDEYAVYKQWIGGLNPNLGSESSHSSNTSMRVCRRSTVLVDVEGHPRRPTDPAELDDTGISLEAGSARAELENTGVSLETAIGKAYYSPWPREPWPF